MDWKDIVQIASLPFYGAFIVLLFYLAHCTRQSTKAAKNAQDAFEENTVSTDRLIEVLETIRREGGKIEIDGDGMTLTSIPNPRGKAH